jgi:Cu(I)/Ag(I) efflux system membrane protein CusA/SilA
MGGGSMGALEAPRPVLLAQAMPGMSGQPGAGGGAGPRVSVPGPPTLSDAPRMGLGLGMPPAGMGAGPAPMGAPAAGGGAQSVQGGVRAFVPLGQLAEIKIVGGPPMVRDEGGLLVGYVYVDIDQGTRDIGGYVAEAKEVVRRATVKHEIHLPAGYFLKWTGQYELLEVMTTRMKIVIPVTLMIVVVLLFLHFKNFVEVLIVLLSIPFALVGSVWLMWLLDYRLSTAVYVGIIALVGLGAQTGIVMIVYIDNAYRRRKQAGKIRDLNDIIWAHMEGTVMRVRPKLMTVGTMLCGLIPLLWATGSGADVMKRIAAPMVGGLLTSAFLTLEIIPVIYTYWRQEQVLWERLAPLDPARLGRLKTFAYAQSVAWAVAAASLVSTIYVTWPPALLASLLALTSAATTATAVAYLATRPAARRLVWPDAATGG